MHDATAHVLRFFDYAHLPPHLQAVSQPFHDLAHALAGDTADGFAADLIDGMRDAGAELSGPEVTVALRKLLEAKDAAVRAALPG